LDFAINIPTGIEREGSHEYIKLVAQKARERKTEESVYSQRLRQDIEEF